MQRTDIMIGMPILDISTPAPMIDEACVESNIARVQSFLDKAGISLRPHIKTHKIPYLASRQAAAGARGITCQKISEAEVFADAGFEDLLLTFNILGQEKLDRLNALNERIGGLKVVADNITTVNGLAQRFSHTKPLMVLVECDTGAGRCGVQTPQEAVALAHHIASAPGLIFTGIMTYPKPDTEDRVEAFFQQVIKGLEPLSLTCKIISSGGTPSLFSANRLHCVTEYRAGTYVYNDRSMVRAGHCNLDDCAMQVLATVVSRPTENRAILDAGSKALTSDLLGFSDYGHILDYPQAVITTLSEEHATVDLTGVDGKKPQIGEKLRIIPNHSCVVSNLFDHMIFHRNGVVTRVEPVAARGMVW